MADVTRARVKGAIGMEPGRRLSFVAFGPSTGPTVIWLHGTPGAATQIPEDARRRAEDEGFRIIGVDRPGVGHSTPHLYGSVGTFSDDLARLMDALDVDTAAVVGLSGGGPYALAASAFLGDRVPVVGVLGGVAPTTGVDAVPGGLVALTRFAQPVLKVARVPGGRVLAGGVRVLTPVADQAIGLYGRFSPEGDRELLSRPEFKAVFLGDLIRRARRRFSAPLADLVLFGHDWGFTLADVNAPVHWWHGTEDNIVPFEHGEAVTARLADTSFRPIMGGGHLAGFGVGDEVLDAVLGI